MFKLKLLLFTFILFALPSLSAQESIAGKITGRIIDAESEYPLIGANIVLLAENQLAAVSDIDGYFTLENIPVGRIKLQCSYLGYETIILDNIMLLAGKALQLDVQLEESAAALEEVIVTARQDELAVNELVATSSNLLQVEEVTRYAGTLGDVARMAQNYAGVSGASDDRNDVIVRGNAPFSVLWRVEGLDIPSPNHWATLGTSGGPVSLLNTNNLRNSDFLAGAFPAEYGNATGAVFDLKLRNGNPDTHEFLGQIGFNGFEVGAEGPLKGIGKKASFLVNYRYSTLGLVQKLGIDFGTGFAVPQYQDVSFKVNIPTSKAGKFSVWGLGGISDIFFAAEPEEGNLYSAGDENLRSGTNTGILGFNHFYFFNQRLSSSFSLLAARSDNQTFIEEIEENDIDEQQFRPFFISQNLQDKYVANWTLNYKIDARNRLKAGLVQEWYDLNVVDSVLLRNNQWFEELNFTGNTSLSRAFVHWQYKWSPKWTLNLGTNLQRFNLNGSFSLEPRLSLSYQASKNGKFAFAYGRHSQLQPLPIYFSKDDDATAAANAKNEQLDFMKSNHYVLSYQLRLKRGLSVKTEAYYQQLSSVATDPNDRDFSILNFGADFGFPNRVGLTNDGKGNNYGFELTLNKQLQKGFYFLWTTSLFQSTYEGANEQERNTYYNSNYVSNVLFGKESNLGKNAIFQINGRFTYGGGRRYTPIDLDASIAEGREIRLTDQPFGAQLAPYIRPDLKIGVILHTKKGITHSYSVDFQNFISRENEIFKTYSVEQERIRTQRQRGFFPDVRYQILF
ncbi:MAG: carboxypeptidase-like regulatory domain-containing protein [Saprospiraceae bacterium]